MENREKEFLRMEITDEKDIQNKRAEALFDSCKDFGSITDNRFKYHIGVFGNFLLYGS